MSKAKNHHHNSSKVGRDQLRIGEYVEVKAAKEVYALSKTNKDPSRPHSRKNSKKALQGIAQDSVKGKVQRIIESSTYKDAAAAATTNLAQTTPNHHYFQGSYQKLF